MSKRGSVVPVPDSWLEQCRGWREAQELTIAELGTRLARAVKRGRPFSEATVRRYLRGALITDDLTRAFADVMNVPPPVVIDHEPHQEWHDLGVRLDEARPRLFEAELERLREIVALVEELRDDDSDD